MKFLKRSCISCHGADSQKGGLKLDTLEFAKKGGDSGPAIVAHNKSESLLLERIHLPSDDEEIMPPKTDLSPKNTKTYLIVGYKLVPFGQREFNLLKLANKNLHFAKNQKIKNLDLLMHIHLR